MTIGPALPAPLDVAARAVLNHPDQRSDWLVVVAGALATLPDVERLAASVPLTAARLGRGEWVPGPPGPLVTSTGDPLASPDLWRRIRLRDEPPLRVVGGPDGRVALAAHHAAFDGLSLLQLLQLLTDSSAIAADMPPELQKGRGVQRPGMVQRLLHPADRVAPSAPLPADEARVWRSVQLRGAGITARLARAVADAVADHNRRRGHRWRRVGVSFGMGGKAGIGNLATYRRVDVDLEAGDDVGRAVEDALAWAGGPPLELRRAPRALRLLGPVTNRLGDSFLISNLGRHDLGTLRDVLFFPVARGRSAVAVGAVGDKTGAGTVTLRGRDLIAEDAEALLDGLIARLRP